MVPNTLLLEELISLPWLFLEVELFPAETGVHTQEPSEKEVPVDMKSSQIFRIRLWPCLAIGVLTNNVLKGEATRKGETISASVDLMV